MYLRILLNFILALGLFTLQASFLNVLPVLYYLNLVLVILIFILVLMDLNWAIAWFLIIALCFDVFSFQAFGTHLITYSLVLIISYILLINFITNRSLYSFLLLTAVATIIYNVSLQLASYLMSYNSSLDFSTSFWINVGWRLLANLIITGIVFYILSLFSRRFKPVFLGKKVFK
ncbi:MAG: hypothetical protein V1865_01925 [bacterium]